MSDFTRCVSALNKAAGRELDADEVQNIFERIQRTARDIAAGRIDTGGKANLSTPEGLMQHAAELAAGEMVADKVLQQRRAHLQVAAIAERTANIDAMKGGGNRRHRCSAAPAGQRRGRPGRSVLPGGARARCLQPAQVAHPGHLGRHGQ